MIKLIFIISLTFFTATTIDYCETKPKLPKTFISVSELQVIDLDSYITGYNLEFTSSH